MDTTSPKWFTCTPVPFRGDQSFFCRESGLLSVGLSKLGIESRSVMPGPPMEGDAPRLIRTDYSNLENPEWWASLDLSGVVFYGWGDGRYLEIVRAIKASGTKLVSSMDTCGLISPRIETARHIGTNLSCNLASRGTAKGLLYSAAQLAYTSIFSAVDKKRLQHLEQADVISVVTPQAARLVQRFALYYKRPDIAKKIFYVPHPQLEEFHYDGSPKENIVISVARWQRSDWPQKNPGLLLNALRLFMHERPDYRALIIGSGASTLASGAEHAGIPLDRLELREHVPANELPALYSKCRIGFWTSRIEGQQGTGAQALCCGCSVVSTGGLAMSCFHHYVTRQSGQIAVGNTPHLLADALTMEARDWDSGHRDATKISKSWTPEFHCTSVARRLVGLAAASS